MTIIQELRERYRDFGDAQLSSIKFIYNNEIQKSKRNSVCITLVCINHIKSTINSLNWENLELIFYGIENFSLTEGNSTNAVIFEADYYEKDGLVLFDFGAEVEWVNNKKVGESVLYILANEITFKCLGDFK